MDLFSRLAADGMIAQGDWEIPAGRLIKEPAENKTLDPIREPYIDRLPMHIYGYRITLRYHILLK
jgi:hypothetical protein